MKINIEATVDGAHMPKRQTPGSAGYDLHSGELEVVTIEPGERKLIGTGIKFELPPGLAGKIMSRSGLATKVNVDHKAGLVDSDYRGEVKVVLHNHGRNPFTVHLGDRIAQIVFFRPETPEFTWVDMVADATERGEGGFGSTGVAA